MAALVVMEWVVRGRISFCADFTCSCVLQQNARMSSAQLLAPLMHLPPTMVLPGKRTVQKVLNGETEGIAVQNNKSGDE